MFGILLPALCRKRAISMAPPDLSLYLSPLESIRCTPVEILLSNYFILGLVFFLRKLTERPTLNDCMHEP